MGIAALISLAVCVVWSLLVMSEIESAVDRELRRGLQPDRFGPRGARAAQYVREYRKLFPGGELAPKLKLLQAILYACGVIALLAFVRFK